MERRFFLFLICLSLAFYFVRRGNEPNQDNRKMTEQVTSQPQSQELQGSQASLSTSSPSTANTAQISKDYYYVIENEFQQVVVNAKGGVISEINLPFKGPKSPKSIVLPIKIDREMVEKSPKNALFPFHKAIKADGTQLVQSDGGYYPLLRRDLMYADAIYKVETKAQLLSLNSEYPELSTQQYQVLEHTQNQIVLKAERNGRVIQKKISFAKDSNQAPYCLEVELSIDGDRKGIWVGSGVPEVELISGSPSPAVKYSITRKGSAEVDQIDLPKDTLTMSALAPNWACDSNGFFGVILDPFHGQGTGFRVDREQEIKVPSRLSIFSNEPNSIRSDEYPGYSIYLPLNQQERTLKLRLFAGPFQSDLLNQIDTYYASIDHVKPSDFAACQSFHGWFAFISEPFAKFLLFLMKFFYSICGSWALSIFLITVVLRVLMSPLNTWSMRSMKKMQEIGPKVKAIQEKYKKDPVKAQTEVMALYRDNKVNPVSGCLPLLIQMPFLIGMFDLLKSSFELRGASFIPGWINDLAAPDVLFSWNFSLPLIGSSFHLLPVLLGATMFLQQRLSSPMPTNPAEMTDQQRQQRTMGTMMTVVMTVLFYNFPSGLNIYWISSMLLGILQQWNMNRKLQIKSK